MSKRTSSTDKGFITTFRFLEAITSGLVELVEGRPRSGVAISLLANKSASAMLY